MTREEITNSRAYQVSKAALEYYNEHHQDKDIDLTDAFEEGAKWADKTQIEKVLEFIFEYLYEHPHVNGHICTDSFESLEALEEELIKTMEE